MWLNTHTHTHWMCIILYMQLKCIISFCPIILCFVIIKLHVSTRVCRANFSVAKIIIIQRVCDDMPVSLFSCMLLHFLNCQFLSCVGNIISFHRVLLILTASVSLEHLPCLKAIKSLVELQMTPWCWEVYSVSLSGPTAEDERKWTETSRTVLQGATTTDGEEGVYFTNTLPHKLCHF